MLENGLHCHFDSQVKIFARRQQKSIAKTKSRLTPEAVAGLGMQVLILGEKYCMNFNVKRKNIVAFSITKTFELV